VRGLFEFRPQHFENPFDIAKNIVVPNPNCPVSEVAHRRIAFWVFNTVGMLPAINLQHETPLAACEVREIGPDRLLTHEFAARELPIAKVSPEHKFRTCAPPPQRAGSPGR
jgi:hypothetical protein